MRWEWALKLKDFFKENYIFFLAFTAIFTTTFFWWFAFYPGILTYDSLDQWLQATTSNFNNWHPYFYALILSFLIKIWHTPAVMPLFQILLFTTLVSCFLQLIIKYNPEKKLVILGTICFFCVFPAFGILTITVWKDILFSLAILAGGIFLYHFLNTKNRKALYSFFIFIGLAAVIRHNGFIYLALMVPLLLIMKKVKKEQLYFGIFLSFFVVFIFNFFLFGLFKVNKTTLPREQFNIKIVAAAYHYDRELFTEADKSLLNTLQPLNIWEEEYSCATVDHLTFNSYMGKNIHKLESSPIQDKKLLEDWHRLVKKVLSQGYASVVRDRLCYTPHLLLSQSLYADHIPQDGLPKMSEESKLPELKMILKKVLAKSSQEPYRYLFWNGGIWLGIGLIGIYFGLRKRNDTLLIYSFYCLVALPSVILLAPASDFRYIYPMMLTAVFIPIVYKKTSIKK